MNDTLPPTRLSDMPLTCTSCQRCPATGCQLRTRAFSPDLAAFSRRSLISASAGSLALVTMGGVSYAQTPEALADSTAQTCVTLTPEQTEGPYYIDDLLLRDDITEGKEGIPLNLEITVIDAESCQPVADAAVDIWHTDALGAYSAFGKTTGQTWMRGVQLTDADGVARIATVYPGWYQGRTIHIHLKVHQGGTADDGTYLGGATAHTGQLYFDDANSDEIAQIAPYNSRLDVARTRNEQDGVLRGDITNPGVFLELVPIAADDLAAGFTGTITLGIGQSA